MTRTAVNRGIIPDKRKNFREIISAIYKDAKKEKRNLSLHTISVVIYRFFSLKGLFSFIRSGDDVIIDGFGRFRSRGKIPKRPYPHRIYVPTGPKKRPRRKGVWPMWRYRKWQRDFLAHNHARRIAQARDELIKWRAKNRHFDSKGWKRWTFRNYCSIIHETELIVYKKLVLEIDNKKVADMNNGIFEFGDVVLLPDGKKMIFCNYLDNGECRILMANKFNAPFNQQWDSKDAKVIKTNVADLKPYIDENLFFLTQL